MGPLSRRSAWTLGCGLTLSGLLFVAGWGFESRARAQPESWRAEVETAWAELVGGLEASSRELAGEMRSADVGSASRLDLFHRLQDLTGAPAFAGRTLFLLDSNGEAVAWAGPGLLHEPGVDFPRSGLTFAMSYSAVTVYSIEPLGDEHRTWRAVVGQSLASEALPFQPPGVRSAHVRWAPAPPDAVTPAGAERIDVAGAPSIFVEHLHHASQVRPPARWILVLRWLAWAVLGWTLLAEALLSVVTGRRGSELPALREVPFVPLLAMAAAAAWTRGAQLESLVSGGLVLATGLAVVAVLVERRGSVRTAAGGFLGGVLMLALAALAAVYQWRQGSVDLGSGLAGDAQVVGLRVAGCLAAVGLLGLSSWWLAAAESSDRTAWIALVLVLAAAAGHDLPLVGLPFLALAGGAIVRWGSGVDLRRRPLAAAILLVLATLASATAWEIGFREVFKRELAERYLPKIAPPTAAELAELRGEIDQALEGRDLRDVMPPSVAALDPQDLAFVLWRDSPLSERDGLSALVVESPTGARSSFAFGVALDKDLHWSWSPETWAVPAVVAWQEPLQGEVELLLDGAPWGTARFFFLARPGFRLGVAKIGELEAALVRGEPRAGTLSGVPRPVLYGLYGVDGHAVASPWEESPPLDPGALETDHGLLETPEGHAWYRWAQARDGIEVLFLPLLTPRDGLERVGIHALSALLWVAGVAVVVLLVALPWRSFGDVSRATVRSYSRRLLLVFTGLLLVPLVALNLVLMRAFEERQRREQLANGIAALSSARHYLIDYLRGLDPGFDIETQINRDLLEWLSGVVHHQVNLYWNSQLYASSQQELFTAGLLPKRIPGEVYSRLTLLGYDVGSRTQSTGEVTYSELYAPLDLFGQQAGLFLSVPLLEQEEEVGRELATMRRRALLVTSALFLLLLAVGGRLAHDFTTPILELIRGTERISAGATFLDVTPRDQELEALADAIDTMARRIAEGRQKLMLEKQLVERIVANITSGVVSLDHQRRVLLHNTVAADLLGTEIGLEIETALARRGRMGPVEDFLSGAGEEAAQSTVQLQQDDGDPREWTLTWVPLPDAEDFAALLVVDDATEVLRAQRLEAWAEMARIIAHEIKNPLTPIRLSAEHLRQVYARDRERLDEIFDRCTSNILEQVEELREIASEFSIYSRIPKADLESGDLVAAMREVVDAYGDHPAQGVTLALRAEPGMLAARFDAKLLGRAVRNLIENALRASASGVDGGRVELSVEGRDDQAVIGVVDSGPGVDPEVLPRIFEPYFSTHETGTGLGLAIVRRIVEEHGGRVEAHNRAGGGLEVTVTMPLLAPTLREATP